MDVDRYPREDATAFTAEKEAELQNALLANQAAGPEGGAADLARPVAGLPTFGAAEFPPSVARARS